MNLPKPFTLDRIIFRGSTPGLNSVFFLLDQLPYQEPSLPYYLPRRKRMDLYLLYGHKNKVKHKQPIYASSFMVCCIGYETSNHVCGSFLYIYIYIYCHVIAHADDRNKINTILSLEWTVATRQKSDR